MSQPRRTWPPARDRDDRAGRPDYRAARQTARHLAEGWAIDLAEQRKLAAEYRDHLREVVAELRTLQRAAGAQEHDCDICRAAAAPPRDADAAAADTAASASAAAAAAAKRARSGS